MKYRWKLDKHLVLFEKYFRLDEFHVSHELFAGGNSPVFTREIFERGSVVAVLPYDPRRGKVVLIEQFRAGAIDERGIEHLLQPFLDDVTRVNGLLHVSLDVDFIDPDIAPAVGTTVPGGATFREAHHVMELLHDSGLVTSLDLVELNPFLDDRGRTARLMVDLTASLFGRRVLDRPTASY